MPRFNLIPFSKALSANTVNSVFWTVELEHMNFDGHPSDHNRGQE